MKNEFEVQKSENSRKNVFETPQLEVIWFKNNDIIVTSGDRGDHEKDVNWFNFG